MVALPADKPVTIPLALTDILVLLLLHMPPTDASFNEVDEPMQILVELILIGCGNGFTIIVLVAMQPLEVVKDITAVPVVIPVTTPVLVFTCTLLLLLLHVPVPELLKVVVAPTHTPAAPEIAGAILTVNVAEAVVPQPVL